MKINKYVLNSCITALALSILLVAFFIVLKVGSTKKIKPVDTKKETADQITISFDSAGGSTVKDIKINKNDSLKLPTVTKDGYKFLGWYLDDTKVSDKTKFIKDTKLKAKWEKEQEEVKTFTVSFNAKGGTAVSSITVNCDEELKLPKSPTKEGYDFVSWVDKNDTPILDGALLACHDITLYANWKEKEQVKTFTVSFDSKGGSTVSSVNVICDNSLKLPPAPTREGFEFIGWVDQNGKSILDGTKFTCEDVTLYASWKEIEKEEPKEEPKEEEETKEEDEEKKDSE